MAKDMAFLCEVCNKVFTLRGNLKVHSRTHTGEKPFLCDVCGRAFPFKQGLQLHQLSHTGEKPASCGVCGKGFRDKQSVRCHQIVHTGGKPFVCGICSKGYTSSRNLRQHRQIHSKGKPCVCSSCGVVFSRQNSLRKHIKKFHIIGKPVYCHICGCTISQENVLKILLQADAVMKEFVCLFCNDPVQKRRRLMNQQQADVQEQVMMHVAHEEVCPDDHLKCHPEEKNNKARDSEMDNGIEPHNTCWDNCGDVSHPETNRPTEHNGSDKTSKTPSQELGSVKELHHSDSTSNVSGPETERFTESGCGDGCGVKSNPETNGLSKCHAALSPNEPLDRNPPNASLQKSGPETRQEVAVRVESPAGTVGGKNRPKRQTSAKPVTIRTKGLFVCNICNKVFKVKGSLEAHQIVHTGEKPFLCDHCGIAFPRKQSLRQHRLRHTGEKPHLCYICGKSFRQDKTLQSHQRVHTGEKPFVCEVCSKAFANPANFRQHCKIHSKVKPYVCSTCKVVFSRRTSLRKHIKKFHVKGKEFECDKCGNTVPRESVIETVLLSSTLVKTVLCHSCAKPV